MNTNPRLQNYDAPTVPHNGPEKKFRAGAISATVWQNAGISRDGEATAYRTISLERSYKDKDGKWQSTTSFRVNDLPRAALMLTKAFEYIVTNSQEAEA